VGVDTEKNENIKIPINPKKYTLHEDASFLVKSKKVEVGVYIDPKEWKFTKMPEDEDAEYQFQWKKGDAYAIFIAEKLEFPIESFKNIALLNARAAATNVVLMKQEYRSVNEKKMMMLQFSGNIQGIDITYLGYYYSYEGGSIQFLAFTGSKLFEEYENELEEILAGIVVLKK
jgi:hypothetical protein